MASEPQFHRENEWSQIKVNLRPSWSQIKINLRPSWSRAQIQCFSYQNRVVAPSAIRHVVAEACRVTSPYATRIIRHVESHYPPCRITFEITVLPAAVVLAKTCLDLPSSTKRNCMKTLCCQQKALPPCSGRKTTGFGPSTTKVAN